MSTDSANESNKEPGNGIRRIEKPKLRIKLTEEVFRALAAGNTFEFDRDWMPYSIVLENWGNLE